MCIQVSVPDSVISELFEVMDVNGDGVISEEEWSDNFEAYINTILKATSEQEEGHLQDKHLALGRSRDCAAPSSAQIPAPSRLRSGAPLVPTQRGQQRVGPKGSFTTTTTTPSASTLDPVTLPPLESYSNSGKPATEVTTGTPLAVPSSGMTPARNFKPSPPSGNGACLAPANARLTQSDRGVRASPTAGRHQRGSLRRSVTRDDITGANSSSSLSPGGSFSGPRGATHVGMNVQGRSPMPPKSRGPPARRRATCSGLSAIYGLSAAPHVGSDGLMGHRRATHSGVPAGREGLSLTPNRGSAGSSHREATCGRSSLTGSRRHTVTPCRQSDRSVVAPPRRRHSVLVIGHQGLNSRSHHAAFTGEVISPDTVKVRMALQSSLRIGEIAPQLHPALSEPPLPNLHRLKPAEAIAIRLLSLPGHRPWPPSLPPAINPHHPSSCSAISSLVFGSRVTRTLPQPPLTSRSVTITARGATPASHHIHLDLLHDAVAVLIVDYTPGLAIRRISNPSLHSVPPLAEERLIAGMLLPRHSGISSRTWI